MKTSIHQPINYDSEQQLDLLTGTYTNIEDFLSVINEALKIAKHQDIQFSYSRLSSRVSVTVPEGKTCTLKKDSPGLVLGIGEIAHDITGSYTFPIPTLSIFLREADLFCCTLTWSVLLSSTRITKIPECWKPSWFKHWTVSTTTCSAKATSDWCYHTKTLTSPKCLSG